MNDHSEDDSVLFSRSGNTNPLGKCTEELKCMVDEETKEAFLALARQSGLSKSEYLRIHVQYHVHGHARMVRERNRY